MKMTKQELIDKIKLYPDKYPGDEIVLNLINILISDNPRFTARVLHHVNNIAIYQLEDMVEALNMCDEMGMYASNVLEGHYVNPSDPEGCKLRQVENLTSMRGRIKRALGKARRLSK